MKNSNTANYALYVACGMVLGSAVGTAAAVMMSAKGKKPQGIRDRAVNAADTVGAVMQSIANMVR